MKIEPRLFLVGAAIVLPVSLGLWAMARWRPQKIGTLGRTFPAATRWRPQRVGTFGYIFPIEDAVHGPWIYGANKRALNLESGNRAVVPQLEPQNPVSFSPDVRSFAAFYVNRDGVTSGIDWRKCVSGELLRRFTKFQGGGNIENYTFQFSSDGKHLVILMINGVEILPLDGSKAVFFRLPSTTSLSGDSKWVCGKTKHKLGIYSAKTGRLIRSINHGRDFVDASFLSPDGSLLCIDDNQGDGANKDWGAWVCDVHSGAKLWDLDSVWGNEPEVLFSPDK